MFAVKCLTNTLRAQCSSSLRWMSSRTSQDSENTIIDPPDTNPPLPPSYRERKDENINRWKARLLYQSRKRGMLENGLLLSTFAAKYLPTMNADQLRMYDKLINKPSNEWDLYYWATGMRETPTEFQHEVMRMLKEHVKNIDRKSRLQQPALY